MENYHLSIHMASWKESMINRLSNLINCNRSAAKISQVLCSSVHPFGDQRQIMLEQPQRHNYNNRHNQNNQKRPTTTTTTTSRTQDNQNSTKKTQSRSTQQPQPLKLQPLQQPT